MYNEHLGNDIRRKAQANAQPLHASGRSMAFSIETVCTVLLLFVVLAVVVQFFGGAFVSTKHAHGQMQAVVTARQVAEEFQGASTPEKFAKALDADYVASGSAKGTVDAQVEYIAGVPLPAHVDITAKENSTGTVYHAIISIGSDADPSSVYMLETSHYVRAGDAS